jgi:hypothetical protein
MKVRKMSDAHARRVAKSVPSTRSQTA